MSFGGEGDQEIVALDSDNTKSTHKHPWFLYANNEIPEKQMKSKFPLAVVTCIENYEHKTDCNNSDSCISHKAPGMSQRHVKGVPRERPHQVTPDAGWVACDHLDGFLGAQHQPRA